MLARVSRRLQVSDTVVRCSSVQPISLATGLHTSRIGLGCASLMREHSPRRRQALLAAAFERGIRHFDVARMYGLGAAERELGRFAKGRRDQLVIATKFGIETPPSLGRLALLQGPARALLAHQPALRARVKRSAGSFETTRSYDVATARGSLERSLRELGSDYVDVLFLHEPSADAVIDWPELCGYLEDERRAGKLRAWGIAGEQGDCLPLARPLARSVLLQMREDVFSHEAVAGHDPRISYGVLAHALPRFAAAAPHVARDELAAGLMADALLANRHGVVLFGTSRPEHLAVLERALAREEADMEALYALRDELLRTHVDAGSAD
jgi:D-threo-aldose 1-dehydrogenase